MLAYNSTVVVPSFFKPPKQTFQTNMTPEAVANPLSDFVKSFSKDVYAYCDILKFSPNWQQKELLDAYQAGENRIACRAGKGPGKSAATAVALTHWSLTKPKGMLVVTAPTFRQCKDVWLAEAYSRITSSNVDPRLKEYFTFRGTGYGILGAKNAEWGCQLVTALRKEAFQGMHKLYLAFLEEEASGVPVEISNAIQETLSNQKGTFLHIRIGNPNCVLGDTEVFDLSRGLIDVKTLACLTEQSRVTSMDVCTEKLKSQGAIAFYTGEKDCVKLYISTGQQIGLSKDHPVYTPYGWRNAGDLKEKDFVAMPRYLSKPTKESYMSDAAIKVLAYLITDGNTTEGSGKRCSRCNFTNMDEPLLSEFTESVVALGGSVKKGECRGRASTLNCSGMQDYLQQWGIAKCSSKTKRIPQIVFCLPEDKLGLFINRMWACDGSFNRYGPKICLCNKKLIDDIQTLLLRLGIHSTSWFTPTRVKQHHNTFEYLKGRTFDAWTLGITELESQKIWVQKIGQVLVKESKMIFAKGNNPNSDIVPVDYKVLNEILSEMGLPITGKKKGGMTAILRKKYKRVRYLSRQAFQQFCYETGYKGKYAKWASNDIRWVRVKKVVDIGNHPVYDLTVPETENFVANNLIIHNSRLTVFFDSFHKESHRWRCLHWNTEQTPETAYFSRRRNEEIAEEFGKNSDVYRISVLGEFPNLDPNCLISEEDLDACCTEEALFSAVHENTDRSKAIGLDLARYGGDECVAVPRVGGIMYDMWAEKTDPNNAVDKAVMMQNLYGWEDADCMYVVDTSGMGEAVVGSLGGVNRMGKKVHEFYSQNTAIENNKYDDKISEAWVHFAKLVKKRHVYLGPKLDKKLKQQLTTRRYTVTKKGLIKIESKDDYKKNNQDSENGTIGKSPDRADGVVMAFYPHAKQSARAASGG